MNIKRILLFVFAAVMVAFATEAKRMSDLKIYINPGHGGYTSNDRPILLYPFESASDTLGYWESKSNLYKGLHMYHILDSLGATPYLSRIKNTEDDDRSLSGISAEANDLGVDLFFSIHTNAGEAVNYPLMLYREQTIGTPRYPENVTLSEILGNNLYSNQLPVWTHKLQIAGDLTFYQNMWSGGLGVLRYLYVPGLLSEGGMHEHRPEAYRLMNDDYWWLEAWHFVRSIMEFYDTEDRFVTGNVAGIVYDDHNLREKDMTVNFTRHGRDIYAPVNGCLVELLDADGNVVQRRTTDNMYNGVFVFRNVAPGDYRLRTTHSEYYSEEVQVTVVANEVTYNDLPLSMKREYPLQIVKYSPVDVSQPISCAVSIEFDFNTDIDTESFEAAFSVTPAVDGYFEYSKNNHHAVFYPTTAFERNTTYTVRLARSASHPDRRYANPGMEQDFEITFTTQDRNRMELLSQFPIDGGEIHFDSPRLEFRFDNKVETSGIYDRLTIRDSRGKVVSVNKRGCSFNKLSNGYGNAIFALSSNLTPGETYTATLSGEVRDAEQLPMGQDITFTFQAVDVSAEAASEAALIDDFEAATVAYTYSADDSEGIGAATPATSRSTTSILGTYAGRFGYAFADQRGGACAWTYSGDTPAVINSGDVLSFFVNGDFNYHHLEVGLTAGTDIKWLPATQLTFLGWQYVEVDTSQLDPSYTYLLAGFRLVQEQSLYTLSGAFYIDQLQVKRNAGITDISADTPEWQVQYFNLQGIEVTKPEPGNIYIRRQGSTATTVRY